MGRMSLPTANRRSPTRHVLLWLVPGFFLASGVFYAVAPAHTGTQNSPVNTTADAVLGQSSMTTNASGSGPAALHAPFSVAIDSSSMPGHLYIADTQNNRILGWGDAATFSNGAPADIVLGQPDFNSTQCSDGRQGNPAPTAGTLCLPSGVAVDGNGNVYVADGLNDRVLEYDKPLATCASLPCIGPVATRVFGQSDFTNSVCGAGADGLCGPAAVALDASGDLYVADAGTNRVLEYDQPLAPGGGTPGVPGSAGDTTADMIFGNNSSTTNFPCPVLTGPDAPIPEEVLCGPDALAVDKDGNLYVADPGYSRVLEFDDPLAPGGGTPHIPGAAGDTTADRVFGQPSFTTTACAGTVSPPSPLNANNMCDPTGVAADQYGNLYIADSANERVVEYNIPLHFDSSEPGAGDNIGDNVFGQPNFSTNSCGNGTYGDPAISANGLCYPAGLATDPTGNLYLADSLNNRVLRYDAPLPPPGPPGIVPPVALVLDPSEMRFQELFAGSLTFPTHPQRARLMNPKSGPRNPLGQPFALFGIVTPAPFSIDQNTTSCASGMVLQPGVGCDIGLTFLANQFGLQKGTLTINDQAENAPQIVKLRGNGTGVPLIIRPTTVGFGKVTVGGTDTRKLTIIDPAGLENFGICGPGTDPNEFSVIGFSFTPRPYPKVVYTLGFTPAATGSHRAEIPVCSDSMQGVTNVLLIGVGIE